MKAAGMCMKAAMAILFIFMIGALGYFAFSADGPDGLERTMENAGVAEHGSVYDAPLDYGEDYQAYLLTGVIGFVAVIAVSLFIAKMLAKKNETQPDR